eukprot:6061225-Alexandrium_andersonii.AAC.1
MGLAGGFPSPPRGQKPNAGGGQQVVRLLLGGQGRAAPVALRRAVLRQAAAWLWPRGSHFV